MTFLLQIFQTLNISPNSPQIVQYTILSSFKLFSRFPIFTWTRSCFWLMLQTYSKRLVESRTSWPKMAEDILVITFFINVFLPLVLSSHFSLKRKRACIFISNYRHYIAWISFFSRLHVFGWKKMGRWSSKNELITIWRTIK